MVTFEFEKILELSMLNRQFFSLSTVGSAGKMLLKAVLLLLTAPIYLVCVAMTYALYFEKMLLTIPSKLIHGIRMANTPYDEANRLPFNITYILLYVWIVPFDAFAIFCSWLIAVNSLFLDFLGNVVCFGERHLAAFELCFSTERPEKPLPHRHFWLTVLALVLIAVIVFVGLKLAATLATTYEKVNTGFETIKVAEIDPDVYQVMSVVSYTLAYLVPTVVLITVYSVMKEKEE